MADATAARSASGASLRFGRFELQPGERRLLADGQPVTLGARAFDLLTTLAARPDRLVTKSELLDLVWPDLVVEESNLHTQMSALRRVLGGDVIATVPGRGYRFAAPMRPVPGQTPAEQSAPSPHASGVSTAAPAAAPPAGGALPAIAGRLIGRDADLDRLESALREPGCVTVVGPGGVGKTRLVLAVAQRWNGRRVWIDLAPLTEDLQVAGTLARALGLPVADGDAASLLVRALGAEPVLLVLDNAEHLIHACAQLAASLLVGVAQLRLLVTSQLALSVAGERVQRIEPLSIESDGVAMGAPGTPGPDGTARDVGAPAAGSGAIALLIERIVAADHRVPIGAESAPLLREICRQLDGLPLALEMAAARVPLLGLKGVRDELAQRFALLTTGYRLAAPRHRTLHAALDWSYQLLSNEERRLFAALGVFAGGFTLDLCIALVADEAAARWDVIDRLATLVDRSLVAVGSDDPPRYRLLETMRAFALEKLAASGTEPAVRRRQAESLIAYFKAHTGSDRGHALCVAEIDNVGDAMTWARSGAPELAVEMAVQTTRVTTFSPWRGQACAWIAALRPLMDSPAAEAFGLELHVRYWSELARALISTMNEEAHVAARRARELARRLGKPMSLFWATVAFVRSARSVDPEIDAACADLVSLGAAHPEWPARIQQATKGTLALAAQMRGDPEARLAFRREELAIAREAGTSGAADAAETNVIAALNGLGRFDEALALANAVVARLSSADGPKSPNLPWAWDGLLCAMLELGRVEEARERLPRAIADCRECRIPVHTWALARVAAARGSPEAAARLVGYVRQALAHDGVQKNDELEGHLRRVIDHVLPALGAARVEALVQEGRRLTEAQAIQLACGDTEP